MIGQQHVNTIREKLTKRADMNWCIKTLLNNHILSFQINPSLWERTSAVRTMNATSDPFLSSSAQETRSTTIIAIETFFCVLIDVLALGGNALVCLAVLRNARLRSPTSMFIIALSISDILMAILCIPVTAALFVSDDWIYGSFLCKLQGYAIHNLGMISVSTMALTAVNRFVRVIKPVLYKSTFTKRNSVCLLAAVWLAIVVFYLTVLLSGSTAVRYESGYSVCAIAHVMSLVVFESSLVGLSLLLIVFSYFQVFKTIRRHQASVAASLHNCPLNTPGLTGEEIKMSKVLFVTVLGFGSCWVPSVIIVTMDRTVDGPMNPSRSTTVLCTYLGYLSCAINPVIYGVMNRAFRAEYKSIILCKKTAAQPAQPTKFRQKVRLLMWTSAGKHRGAGRADMQLDDISAAGAILP